MNYKAKNFFSFLFTLFISAVLLRTSFLSFKEFIINGNHSDIVQLIIFIIIVIIELFIGIVFLIISIKSITIYAQDKEREKKEPTTLSKVLSIIFIVILMIIDYHLYNSSLTNINSYIEYDYKITSSTIVNLGSAIALSILIILIIIDFIKYIKNNKKDNS